MKNYSIILFMILVFNSCKKNTNEEQSRVAALPFYSEASFTPYWFQSSSEKVNQFHKIPNFSLTNQLGELVNNETFSNKIYVADFFFTTCPGICLKMTANMSIVQEAFIDNDDVLLLSHSVTPEKDSIPVLMEYAKDKGILPNKWHLVTGDRKQIYDLGRKAYFVEEDLGEIKSEEDFLHTENFVLIDKNRHIRGIYNGLNKASIQQLIADVKTLQIEN